MNSAVALLETTGLGPTLVALDALEKAADVRLHHLELNDYYGVCMKITGMPGALRAAMDAGRAIVERLGGQCVTAIINAPDPQAWRAIRAEAEFQPLIQQEVVFYPQQRAPPASGPKHEDPTMAMATATPFAIGLIETQGFTAVLNAIDTACKAANVEVLAKEKLGGGYITVLIKGDVAAVEAAVAAGQAQVERLGKLIAAHVIPRPSHSILSLITPVQP